MGEEVGQPGRIVHVGLAARHGFDELSIGQDENPIRLAQHGPDRLPIDARGLHDDVGDAITGQPGRQALQVRRGGGEGLDMSLDTPALGQAHAGHDAVLMNVKSGAAWVKTQHLWGGLCKPAA